MSIRAPVYLGLGSNLGAREAHLAGGVTALGRRGFRRRRGSSLYLTEPVGGPPQAWFVNAVVEGETDLTPGELLAACLDVERELGRVRDVPHGPRTLDVDILLYGDLVLATPELSLPHPRLHQRRFVLAPLAEIAPGAVHPGLGATAAQLLERCTDPARVLLHQPQRAGA